MNAGARLGLYGLGLAIAFGGAYAAAGALVPEEFVTEWIDRTDTNHTGDTETHTGDTETHPRETGAPAGTESPAGH